MKVQSDSVIMDTEGAIESVLIKGVSVLSRLNLEKISAFFPQRQRKLSVIMGCMHQAVVCKVGFHCIIF